MPHLNNHDVTLTAVSRAPLDSIQAYRSRMGWRFPWASSNGSAFNFDYHVSFTPAQLAADTIPYNFTDIPASEGHDELHGLSAFYRDEAGAVFHTYSAYARGIEQMLGTMMALDRAPLGRNEHGTMHFVRRHDEYGDAPPKSGCHG